MLERLKKYLKETPPEQIKKDWDESKEFDKVGPTINEFLSHIKKEKSDFKPQLLTKEELEENRIPAYKPAI